MGLTKFSLLKRRAGSTRAAFARHWRTTHLDVLVRHARHQDYNRRYLQVEFMALPGLGEQTLDGAAQIVPRSAGVVLHGLQQGPLYLCHVRPDEEQFLDVAACAVLYCESADFGQVDDSGRAFKALVLVQPAPGAVPDSMAAAGPRRAAELLAQGSAEGLLGMREHRVLPRAATRMQDGTPLPEVPARVEELFFDRAAALQAFCSGERSAAGFPAVGALPPGQGSHVFAALEHLVYEVA